MSRAASGRRDFLRLGAGCALAGLAATRAHPQLPAARPVPRVNGGINVQPARLFDAGLAPRVVLEPEIVTLQLRVVYELGFQQIRVTLPFGGFSDDFLGAIPYVRAARALGIDVLGVLSDFAGLPLVQALTSGRRQRVLSAYLDVFDAPLEPAAPEVERLGALSLQVLNEPTHFTGITPDDYVSQLLRPSWEVLKALRPELPVVAAAFLGNVDGLVRVRRLFELGYESYCDLVAYHIFSRRLISGLAGLATKPVLVTESGVASPAAHLDWYTGMFAQIRAAIENTAAIYWFDLFDPEPDRFRLIGIESRSDRLVAVAESPQLLALLEGRVAEAIVGGPEPLPFEALVPDITRYFPTADDLERIGRSPLP